MRSPRRVRHGSPEQADRSTSRTFPKKGVAEACAADVGGSSRDGGADRHQPGAVWPEEAGAGRTTLVATVQEGFQGQDRGRDAETPAEIPAKGWKDIAWRVYDGIQNDRVLRSITMAQSSYPRADRI